VIAQRMLLTSIGSHQSLLLAAAATVVAYLQRPHVYVVAVLTLIGKVVFCGC
jgi:hypothetical protein